MMDTPAVRFDAYLDVVEHDPQFRARREKIAALEARLDPHPIGERLLRTLAIVTIVALWGGVAMRWIGAP